MKSAEENISGAGGTSWEFKSRKQKSNGRDFDDEDEEIRRQFADELRLVYGFETTKPRPLGTVVKGLLHRGSVHAHLRAAQERQELHRH